MNFNSHPSLKGRHAVFTASTSSWIRYDDAKMYDRLDTMQQAALGTRLHNFAAEAIELGIKMPKSKTTMNMYINDAISFRMTPEQVLFFSYNFFGTTDAISFRRERPKDEKLTLRIHDLKTGVSKASVDQLLVYVALFCLEYEINPNDINIELRIYKQDDIEIYVVDEENGILDVIAIMAKIKHFDDLIEKRRQEVGL